MSESLRPYKTSNNYNGPIKKITVAEKNDTWEGNLGHPSNQHLVSMRNIIAEQTKEIAALSNIVNN